MTQILRKEPHDVAARLQELGLTIAELQEVGRIAYVHKGDCSPLSPPTFPGTVAWGQAVITLREIKLPHGWRKKDPGNFSMTINDEPSIYIVVASGDQFAGITYGKTPTTKTPKGYKTEQAVNATRQIAMDLGTEDAAIVESTKCTELYTHSAWFFLINIQENSVMMEISRPSEIIKGKITSWEERIIIPTLSMESESDKDANDGDNGGFNPDIDINIQPLGS
ncbi:hypothetical protein LHT11_06500 [Acetobacter indonesiensis]|uniref:hypothetical protein n=1 Tax=Acetobacter indonesiensis TaxID=104101 RepID=UPI001F2F61CB|nr:hypothetical protein [Acetobacter indonesiensis]MCG0994850.1 hypothetical protein [Acetobacter indonesiensis]